MKADERRLLEDIASLADIDGWVSPVSISENYDEPIHERRVRYLIEKWDRHGYWSPLLSTSGTFTDAGWAWVASLGIERGGTIAPEQQMYAQWLAADNPSPHGPDRNGYYCCIGPDYSHRVEVVPSTAY